MNLLKRVIHPSIKESNLSPSDPASFTRVATRAIVIKNNKILLMFTRRYNDYSLPGGGVDDGEALTDCLKRELSEETGARNIRNIQPFGVYEEYRPYKNIKFFPDCTIMHMLSYCYTCEIDDDLGESALEEHEVSNGMEVCWVGIQEAIDYNLKTINDYKQQGLSIERETYLLKVIKSQLVDMLTDDIH